MESLGRLGIDISALLLYAVNFGIVVLVLGKFFTKPVIEMMEKRRKVISDNVGEAEKLKEELVKAREKMAQEKQEMQTRMEEEMKRLHQEIEQKRKDADAEIDAKKAKMIEDVKHVVSEEKANLKAGVQKEVLSLVEKMVLHIVHNKVPKEVIEESTQEAWKLYKQ
ncbi:MAG: ATP synthase F0 subunit B [Candidatus Gracilibacteria bacterium]|nr:ATP synthase F0 subunit B [Candidatus Peregrinibacteria bacterium]